MVARKSLNIEQAAYNGIAINQSYISMDSSINRIYIYGAGLSIVNVSIYNKIEIFPINALCSSSNLFTKST